MKDYRVILTFDENDSVDITHLVKDNIVITEYASNSSLKNCQNNLSMEIVYDPFIFEKIANCQTNIFIDIYDGVIKIFAGFMPPNIVYTTDGHADSLSVEIEDYCSLLRSPIKQSLVMENAILYDPYKPSLCTELLIMAGFNKDFWDSNVSIPNIVRAFSVEEEDENSYYDVLNNLLFEFGYALRFNAEGKFSPYKWINQTLKPTVVFDEGTIVNELVFTKNLIDISEVKVTWYEISEKKNVAVYVSDIPIASDGKIIGYPIQPGIKYPPEANVNTIKLQYSKDALEHILSKDRVYETDKADISKIIITKNHYVDIHCNNATIYKSEFNNSYAELVLINNTNKNITLKGMDIYADVVWRSLKRLSSCDTGINIGSIENIYTNYISNPSEAESLCRSVASYKKYGRYTYDITSTKDCRLGTIVKLSAKGMDQLCYIVSKCYELSFDIDGSYLFKYELKGLGDAEISVSTTSMHIANTNSKLYQDIVKGNIYIGGIPATSIADKLPPSGGGILSVVPENNGIVKVNWSEYKDNPGGSGMGGYRVYRAEEMNNFISNAVLIGHASKDTTVYIDATAEYNKKYYYGVSAYDRNNNESNIDWSKQSVEAKNIIPPGKPENLSWRIDKGKIILKWDPPYNQKEITYYEIFRDNAFLSRSGTDFYEDLVQQNIDINYTYKVRSYNLRQSYSLEFSNTVRVRVDLPAKPVICNYKAERGAISFDWASDSNPEYYIIYKNNQKVLETKLTHYTEPLATTNKKDIELMYYRVAAVNKLGLQSTSEAITPIVTPPLPIENIIKGEVVRGAIKFSFYYSSNDSPWISHFKLIADNQEYIFKENRYDLKIGKIEKLDLINKVFKFAVVNIYGAESTYSTLNGFDLDFTNYGTYKMMQLRPETISTINTVTVSWIRQYDFLDYKEVEIEYRKLGTFQINTCKSVYNTSITGLSFDKDHTNQPIETVYEFRIRQISNSDSKGEWSDWVQEKIIPADYKIIRADELEADISNLSRIKAGWIAGAPCDPSMPEDQKLISDNNKKLNYTTYIDFRSGNFRFGDKVSYLYGDFSKKTFGDKIIFSSVKLNLSSTELETNEDDIYLRHVGKSLEWWDTSFNRLFSKIYADSTGLSLNSHVNISRSLSIATVYDEKYKLKVGGKSCFEGDIHLNNHAKLYTNRIEPSEKTLLTINHESGSDVAISPYSGNLGICALPSPYFRINMSGSVKMNGLLTLEPTFDNNLRNYEKIALTVSGGMSLYGCVGINTKPDRNFDMCVKGTFGVHSVEPSLKYAPADAPRVPAIIANGRIGIFAEGVDVEGPHYLNMGIGVYAKGRRAIQAVGMCCFRAADSPQIRLEGGKRPLASDNNRSIYEGCFSYYNGDLFFYKFGNWYIVNMRRIT